jgi:hypothetical protein
MDEIDTSAEVDKTAAWVCAANTIADGFWMKDGTIQKIREHYPTVCGLRWEDIASFAHTLAAERDRLAAQLAEARAAWEAFKGATVSDDHFAAVDRLDKALGVA